MFFFFQIQTAYAGWCLVKILIQSNLPHRWAKFKSVNVPFKEIENGNVSLDDFFFFLVQGCENSNAPFSF